MVLSPAQARGRNLLAVSLLLLGLVVLDSAVRGLPHDRRAWDEALLGLIPRTSLYLQLGHWSVGSPPILPPHGAPPPAGNTVVGAFNGLVFQCLLLVFCSRGNRIAVTLTRGLVALYGALCVVLIVFVVGRGGPFIDPVASTGKIVAVGFACWALFASRSVRAFLARQEARPVLLPPIPG